MEKLQEKIEKLDISIKKIEKRNKRVEVDKAWETSTYRKVSVALVTYTFMITVMYLLKIENVFINALIPTFGYILSTLWINILKKNYIKNKLK